MPNTNSNSRPAKSEKFQNSVHSFNYKLGEILKKEVQCLNREEKNTACSTTIDQRIITTRFRNRLSRSVELMKYHDKIRSRFHHADLRHNSKEAKKTKRQPKMGQSDSLEEENENYAFDEEFSLKKFTDLGGCKNRPKTAVETKSRLWSKRADTAKERVVRAKSAPPSSWRNCEEIIMKLNSGGGGFYTANKVERPLSRAKFYEVFDTEKYGKFREKELEKQSRRVKSFIESIEELKLNPWYPGPPEKSEEKQVTLEEMTNRSKQSGFVTRVDSYY